MWFLLGLRRRSNSRILFNDRKQPSSRHFWTTCSQLCLKIKLWRRLVRRSLWTFHKQPKRNDLRTTFRLPRTRSQKPMQLLLPRPSKHQKCKNSTKKWNYQWLSQNVGWRSSHYCLLNWFWRRLVWLQIRSHWTFLVRKGWIWKRLVYYYFWRWVARCFVCWLSLRSKWSQLLEV